MNTSNKLQPKRESGEKKPPQTTPTPPAPVSVQLSPETLGQALPQARLAPEKLNPRQTLQLQRTLGNHSVQRLIQPKLTVGAAGDRYEQEADRVADQVVRSAEPKPVARKKDGTGIQRKSNKEGFEAGPEVEQQITSLQGGGSPLPDQVRRYMEPRFGADFGQVRLHTDNQSAQLNHHLQAKAFTHGNDIYMGAGNYDPGSDAGKTLLAHELTHTIQQTGSVSRSLDKDKPQITSLENKAGAQRVQREFSFGHSLGGEENDIGSAEFMGGTNEDAPDIDGPEDPDLEDLDLEGGPDEKVGSGKRKTEEKYEKDDAKKTASATKKLAGAEAYTRILKQASDEQIREAAQAVARVGLFGEAKGKKEWGEDGKKAGFEGKAAGEVGMTAKLEAVHNKQVKKIEKPDGTTKQIIEAITYFAQATLKAGASGSLEGKFSAEYGIVGIEIAAKLEAFAGAVATASGGIHIDNATLLKQVTVMGKARSFAGANFAGEAGTNLKLDEFELETKVKGEGEAGAKAEAGGEVSIGMQGIAISGQAEVGAGASVKAGGSTELGYKGKKIFSMEGSVSASVGVGAKIGGTFSFKGGKLVLGGALAATLGLGAGVDFKVEVDFKAIAEAIGDLVKRVWNWGKNKKRDAAMKATPAVPLAGSDFDKLKKAVHDAALPSFSEYVAKKSFKGSGGVYKERLEEIINKKVRSNAGVKGFQPTPATPTGTVTPQAAPIDPINTVAADEGITEATREAMGSRLKDIEVRNGLYVKLEAEAKDSAAWTGPAKIKPGIQQALGSEITDYIHKKRRQGANPPKQAEIESIIAKRVWTRDLPKDLGKGKWGQYLELTDPQAIADRLEPVLDGIRQATQNAFMANDAPDVKIDYKVTKPATLATAAETKFTQFPEKKDYPAGWKK